MGRGLASRVARIQLGIRGVPIVEVEKDDADQAPVAIDRLECHVAVQREGAATAGDVAGEAMQTE